MTINHDIRMARITDSKIVELKLVRFKSGTAEHQNETKVTAR